MNLNKTQLVYFSPTGTSKKVLEFLSRSVAFGEVSHLDLTSPLDRLPVSIPADELTMIAAPVYAGRVAATAVARLKKIKGEGGPVVVVVLYGNREYEDALLELRDLALSAGFRPLAGCAFIGEHSYSEEDMPIGAGRPDEQDGTVAAAFGARIVDKLAGVNDPDGLGALAVPGQFPYKDGVGAFPFTPVVEEALCTLCGICVDICPTGAVELDGVIQMDSSRCIYCCACKKSCPDRAIQATAPPIMERRQWLYANCSYRKEPQLFL